MKNQTLSCMFLILAGISLNAPGQGINNIWLMGYSSSAGLPFGNTRIDFSSGVPNITYDSINMNFSITHANISDSAGNLLFYTNGYYIADANDDTMQNGAGINPSVYTSQSAMDGLTIPQSALIIPVPWSNHLYYLFHNTADGYPNNEYAYYFYVSIIDINLNNGLGAVTSKNVILLSDSMNIGKITACKHANGRDWWVVCHRVNTDTFLKFLVTPYGIYGPYQQNIGAVRPQDVGQAKFSPDGTRYAYLFYNTGLDIFEFDRCTGIFFNPTHISTPSDNGWNTGMEFSPNSDVLYMMNLYETYQYDLTNANIPSTQIVVAEWDSFYSPTPPFSTLFSQSQLAPDGKIYITTGNSTFFMHVINNPDSLGLGCDLVQHSIPIPAFYFSTVPNHPNYFLGKIAGGPCDTVQFNPGLNEINEAKPNIFPNPTSGKFTLWFKVHDKEGLVELFDTQGKCIRNEFVSSWSQYKKMDISQEPAGIYFCRIRWGMQEGKIKIIKE